MNSLQQLWVKHWLTKAVMPYCALAIVTHTMDGMIKPLSGKLLTKHIRNTMSSKNREINSSLAPILKLETVLFLFLCFKLPILLRGFNFYNKTKIIMKGLKGESAIHGQMIWDCAEIRVCCLWGLKFAKLGTIHIHGGFPRHKGRRLSRVDCRKHWVCSMI